LRNQAPKNKKALWNLFQRALNFKWGDECRSHPKNDPQVLVSVREGFSSYEWFRDKAFLTREYIEQEKSIAQIAREVGFARSTVVKFLLESGIGLRKKRLLCYRKSQLAYGERIKGGRTVPHLGEISIIKQFSSKRSAGSSYAEIAHWANKQGISPTNRVSRWDRRTIFEILRRNRAP